jgi:hypothetical protein
MEQPSPFWLLNFYHCFLLCIAKVLCPVTYALPVLWTPKMNASFLPFKQDHADYTVLAHQLSGAAFSLQVNASAIRIRAGLETVISGLRTQIECYNLKKCLL